MASRICRAPMDREGLQLKRRARLERYPRVILGMSPPSLLGAVECFEALHLKLLTNSVVFSTASTV